MATLQSGAVTSNSGFTPHPNGTVGVRRSSYELTAALAADDVIEMVNVYAGETVLGVFLTTDDLDSHGTPTITLDVGYGGDVDAIIDGSVVGKAGGSDSSFNSAVAPVTFATDDTIDVTVAVGPATGATTGTVTVTVVIAG